MTERVTTTDRRPAVPDPTPPDAPVPPWGDAKVVHEWSLGREGKWRYVVALDGDEAVVWMTQANGIWKSESGLWADALAEAAALRAELAQREADCAALSARLERAEANERRLREVLEEIVYLGDGLPAYTESADMARKAKAALDAPPAEAQRRRLVEAMEE